MRWLARGEAAVPTDPGWLTPGEAGYAAGLRYTKRRTEYLLRRLAAKHAVAATVGLPADPAGLARIEVRNAASGAPYVLVDGAPADVEVSISDRAGWAVCLVGARGSVGPGEPAGGGGSVGAGAVGCDLELVEPRSPGFVRDFLTEVEQAYVAEQPDEDARYAAVNLLWSAKESGLKVLRTGLRRDTRSVEVSVQSVPDGQFAGWAPLTVHCVEGRSLPGWWRRDGRYLFTVAAPAPCPPPIPLENPDVLSGAVPVHSWLDRPLSAQNERISTGDIRELPGRSSQGKPKLRGK